MQWHQNRMAGMREKDLSRLLYRTCGSGSTSQCPVEVISPSEIGGADVYFVDMI